MHTTIGLNFQSTEIVLLVLSENKDLMSYSETMMMFLPKLTTNNAASSASLPGNWSNLSHSGRSV